MLGRLRAAIRVVPWQDSQLPVDGLAHAGLTRGPGDGGAAAVSARKLDKRSLAHGVSARS